MSANVEVVRRITGAINRRDIDFVIRHTTEDVVIVAARSSIEGPFVGHPGVRKFFSDNAENFEVFELRSKDVRDVGEERVLSIGTLHIRGRGGRVETDIPFAGITTLRDGKASRWEEFRERAQALKAVGLEPGGGV
jgi:ketosteroid isomerase-like protein